MTSTAATAQQPTEGGEPGRTRAAAMAPDARRAAIVAVTIPLLLAHGSNVTTRQIAEAAGIAEGTIFRVFPDKDSVIAAAVEKAFDPEPTEAALRAIDPSLPLEDRLVLAVDAMKRRVDDVWQIMTAVGMTKPPIRPDHDHRKGSPDLTTLALVFEPDADQLRRDPLVAAQLLRGLTMAGSHPALILDEPMASDEIVSLVLDGVRRRPDAEQAP